MATGGKGSFLGQQMPANPWASSSMPWRDIMRSGFNSFQPSPLMPGMMLQMGMPLPPWMGGTQPAAPAAMTPTATPAAPTPAAPAQPTNSAGIPNWMSDFNYGSFAP